MHNNSGWTRNYISISNPERVKGRERERDRRRKEKREREREERRDNNHSDKLPSSLEGN